MRTKQAAATCLLLILLNSAGARVPGFAEDPAAKEPQKQVEKTTQKDEQKLVPLNQQKTVWLDQAGGKLILETEVVFRNGLLEMLVCLKQTKEHESILSLDAQARTVHAGLLALGAKPGTPVNWDPEFQPPSGQEIEITLMWQDEESKWKRSPAQRWLRSVTRKYFIAELKQLPKGFELPEETELRYDPKHRELLWFGLMTAEEKEKLLKLSTDQDYQKAIKTLHDASQIRPMDSKWVFAGSGFFVEEGTGKQYYLAEDGNLICVANFSSAVLDVREESSADGDGLSYEAWEERIPPLGTKVRVELKPVKQAVKEDVKSSDSES